MICIGEGNFKMWAFLEWSNFDVDKQSINIRIRLGG